MRALRMDRTGSLDGLYIADLPKPEPGPGEVLVRIEAAAINPSDIKNVQGAMSHTTTPRTPGRDFAGVVEQGPGEWLGKRVWGSGGEYGFTRDGTHAEYIVRPVDALGIAPSNLSPPEAAACGVPFVTAHTAITAAAVTPAETLVVIGAAGAVGSSAVQVARSLGASVIGVVREERQRAAVEALGAQPIIASSGETLGDAVRAILSEGAPSIFDTVGGVMLRHALAALAPRGRLIEIAAPQREVTIDLLDFYRRDLRLLGVNTLNLGAEECVRILDSLRDSFESGAIKPPAIAKRVQLDDAPGAYADAASGNSGKIVIEMAH